SRVVNDEPGVSPVLTERVRQAVDELGFRPNVGARVLRRADARTASVGLLLDDVADPFAATVLRAVQDAAQARGVVVLSASVDGDAGRERSLAAAFAARRVDGLILLPAAADQSYLAAEVASGTAVVCVGRMPGRLDVDAVVATDAAGAASAVRHLAAAGHTRIAFLGDRAAGAARLAGYRTGLEAAGLVPDPALVVPDLADAALAEQAVTVLFRSSAPPTALFTARAAVTVAALRTLHRIGLQRLVAVIGFGDFVTADLLSPAVTVVAQDVRRIGTTAADLLFARLAGEAGPPATYPVPTVLVPRGSGELPPPPR
ncbi:MAG TPA: LacI family DNA-binding transcriptional regulator, partial [Pseudonocardia sp.]|nr:LacI family DNA-binding transcriptional regulator [Pseudonocardia sp.]